MEVRPAGCSKTAQADIDQHKREVLIKQEMQQSSESEDSELFPEREGYDSFDFFSISLGFFPVTLRNA